MADLDTYPHPNWEIVHRVCHGENDAILSVDVQPSGKRFATGGIIDGIGIWSTSLLRDASKFTKPPSKIEKKQKKKEEDAGCCLALIQRHQGAVNVVRWSSDGRYLASGGDDFIVCIHELQPGRGRSSFGQNMELQMENWACVEMLRGHGLNVVDLAWCPSSDSYLLCTAGLDRSVIMWDASKGTMLRTFKGHENFVKGVAWDPRGEFIASQSDDGSVMVWKVDGEGGDPIAKITEPFEATSTSMSFSSRLSWSPDGGMLCAVGASIQGAVRISREDWSSSIVTVQDSNKKNIGVAISRYNPQIFRWRGESVHYCACGGSRGMFMVLRGVSDPTSNTEEFLVSLVEGQFQQKNVADLAWTPDGQILLAVSMHGTMMKGVFTERNLGIPIKSQVMENQKDSVSSSFASANSTTIHGLAEREGGQSASECSPLTMRKKRRITPTPENDRTGLPLISEDAGPVPDPQKPTVHCQTCCCGGKAHDVSNFFGVPEVSAEFRIGDVAEEKDGPRGLVVTNTGGGGRLSSSSSEKCWSVDMSEPILLGTSNASYIAIVTSANVLQVLSHAGRSVISPMGLPANIVSLRIREDSRLMAAMSDRRIKIWDLDRRRCTFNEKIEECVLKDKVECIEFGVNGYPVVCLKNGCMYAYNNDMESWMLVCSSQSDATFTKQIAVSGTGQQGEHCIPQGSWDGSKFRHYLTVCLDVGNIEQYKRFASRYVQFLLDQRRDSERKKKIEDFCIEVATTPNVDLRDFVQNELLEDVKRDIPLGTFQTSFLCRINEIMDGHME
ncbi:hypothetical protein BSKO_00120 [Bryopsis sp. KO-2023]|nr:hypothetical protein BSKO_00120 [Bryopsis sp. KO-2023]